MSILVKKLIRSVRCGRLFRKLRLVPALVCLLASQLAFALPGDVVNVNKADAETLAEMLDGIGAARAKAIVEYRQTHGDFVILEDLLAIRGIGESVIDNNRERIVFDE